MLGKETIPPGEAEATQRVVEASEALLPANETPVRRGQHPKSHGCLRADFVVEPDLPAEYRVGLFHEPRTYPAWVRFSNGRQQDDRLPDAHGMAVKLMGVDGPKLLDAERDARTHDFIMIDHPTFFIRDAAEYAEFSEAMLKATGKAPSAVASVLGFLPEGPRTFLTLLVTFFLPFRLGLLGKLKAFGSQRLASPLSTQYWSTTPYLFGEGMAMKFSAVPEVIDTRAPEGVSDHYLREVMAERLSQAGASFEFQFKVQLQKDEHATPIEDSTVPWIETLAPPRTVARIKIAAQAFQSPEQMAFGENLSFTPWHAIPEHRPLGGINRVRKDVYTALSRLRHDRNQAPSVEPEPGDPPAGPLALAQSLEGTRP